jgi:precorrin-2 dehydrogenase/sirohydrochlorin ferrochelatase
MVDDQLLVWKRKQFAPEDLKGAWIVIAATDDAETNRRVAQAAEPRQLVNVARPPAAGNVHFPALLTRGKLTVAVSTSGASPRLAAQIRDELAAAVDDAYADYLEFLSVCREWIENNVAAEKDRQRLLARLLDPVYKTSPKEREIFLSELKNGVDKSGRI